jgi:hypothetical protein
MDIKNVIVINNLQYFILSAIFVFAFLSLFIADVKKKFIFLFLFLLFVQVFNFTIYYGELFYIFFTLQILFLVIFYLYNLKIEKDLLLIKDSEKYLSSVKENDNEYKNQEYKNKKIKKSFSKENLRKYYCFIMPVLFCMSFVFLFIKFSSNYTAKFDVEKDIALINFSNVAKEIYNSYEILVLLVVLLIFIIFLWIISLILIRKKD